MEFPDAGKQCFINDCKQLDFLPFICNHCSHTFCKEHFSALAHACPKFTDNCIQDVDSTKEVSSFKCSQENCDNKSPVEILCSKCQIHYCISHRYHGCFEDTTEDKSDKIKKFNEPNNQFSEAKKVVDKEVLNKLGKSKKDTAMKVRLMKLKLKSIGLESIPTTERCYFLVHCPKNNPSVKFDNPKELFVSTYWSIGRIIDSMASLLKIPNHNNQQNATKLRLFNYSDGNIVASRMDTALSDLLNNDSLINGQDIILEYSDSDKIDCSLYK